MVAKINSFSSKPVVRWTFVLRKVQKYPFLSSNFSSKCTFLPTKNYQNPSIEQKVGQLAFLHRSLLAFIIFFSISFSSFLCWQIHTAHSNTHTRRHRALSLSPCANLGQMHLLHFEHCVVLCVLVYVVYRFPVQYFMSNTAQHTHTKSSSSHHHQPGNLRV